MKDRFFLITQNVDGLHSKAGSQRIVEMHGRLSTCFCIKCGKNYHISRVDLSQPIPLCPSCGKYLRPDIVWFGEMPYFLDQIYEAIESCSFFLTVGTSGHVYPAAYFITLARQKGATTIGVNLDKPLNNSDIDLFYKGKAGEILPILIKEILE